MSLCHSGDTNAMLELSKLGDDSISNMWLVRAVLYGNEEAREILRLDPGRASNTFLPLKYLIPGERSEFYSDFNTETVKALGFDSLPYGNDKYKISSLSGERVFYLGRITSYYPPDKDGYGEETDYIYYIYDEFFHRISDEVFVDSIRPAIIKAEEYFKSIEDKLPRLRVDWLLEDKIIQPYEIRRHENKPK